VKDGDVLGSDVGIFDRVGDALGADDGVLLGIWLTFAKQVPHAFGQPSLIS